MFFSFSSSAFLLVLAVAKTNHGVAADGQPRIGRMRNANDVEKNSKWWKSFPVASLFKERNQALAFEEGADEVDGFFQAMAVENSMPSVSPTVAALPSTPPTISSMPSFAPTESSIPSEVPSVSAMPSEVPTVSAMPSHSPTIEGAGLTPLPSNFPTFEPNDSPTDFPTFEPSEIPSDFPTFQPSASPSDFPTLFPSDFPTVERSRFPTFFPTISTSVEGSENPTISPAPSLFPTLSVCEITPEQRIIGILAVLDQVADSVLIRDITTPQGQATDWLLNLDNEQTCPDDPKIIQRWSLAVMYFSMEGMTSRLDFPIVLLILVFVSDTPC
jgi:hypothetical protein